MGCHMLIIWHLAHAKRGSIKTTYILYFDEFKSTVSVTQFALFQVLRDSTFTYEYCVLMHI